MKKEDLINILRSSINRYDSVKEYNKKKKRIYKIESEDYYFQIKIPKLCAFVTMWLGMLSTNQFIDIVQDLKQDSNFDKSLYFNFIIYLVLFYLNICKLKGAKDISTKSENANIIYEKYENNSNAAKIAIEFIEGLTKEEEEKYLNLKI